ncbi:MAG: hypothetical protein ACMG6E_01230 [Candidatus Roizmanbacteria bacterium]
MIIAFSGKYKVGKDTAAELVQQETESTGLRVQQLKFAANLKVVVATITGTSIDDNYSEEGKAKLVPALNKTLGKLQQDVGIILRQHLHPDIWVIPVLQQCLRGAREGIDLTIISDCRFKNEANAIREAGGKVIRINRDIESYDGRDPNHISETDLDDYPDFDAVILNDGTIEQFRQALIFALKGF